MFRRLMFAAALAVLFVGGISTGAGGSPTLITRICSTVTRTITAATTSTVTSISTVISTVTQTVTTPTTQTLTTGTTTMTPPPTSGFGGKLTALYALEDAAQSGTRVSVSTPSQLQAQAANPTAAEVDVQAGTYAGQYQFTASPASVVKYVFAPGVKFTGSACCNSTSGTVYAVWVSGSNLILWGPADVSNPNYNGIGVSHASNVVIGGGIATHNNGFQGIIVQADGGSGPSNVWLDGLESYTNGTAAAATAIGGSWAPCTGGATARSTSGGCDYYKAGIHALYWGSGTTGGGVVNSHFHDQHNGYCIEVQDAVSGSVFAFNTLARCDSPGNGWNDPGAGYELYSNSNETYVANVIVGANAAGFQFCHAAGSGKGDVSWNNPTDVVDEGCGGTLSFTDSHHLDPQLDATDRPLSGSPLMNLASAYASYLPRTDFTGAARITADPGAFAVP